VTVLAALAACSGPSARREGPVPDPQLAQARVLAGRAFERGQIDQAALFYDRALDRAYVRDDTPAIADTVHDLAVVELRRGSAEKALALARGSRQAMTRRGAGDDAGLLLIEAVALYRLGRHGEALTAASRAASVEGASPGVIHGTIFVRGLIAADGGDAAGVQAAIADMGEPAGVQDRADRRELDARLALLLFDGETALTAAMAAADLRREGRDYHGLDRTLAVGALAAHTLGRNTEAADLYLRAGRSAALQGHGDAARPWLMRARDLARATGARDIADEAQRRLDALAAAEAARPPG
jgi:tetratricopeptide (TPR) repeat protein